MLSIFNKWFNLRYESEELSFDESDLKVVFFLDGGNDA